MVKRKLVPKTVKAQNTRRQLSKPAAASSSSPAQFTCKSASSNVPSCCACGIIVTDDVKALQCDRCLNRDIWKCAQCLNLTNDLYDSLTSPSDGTVPLRWFCDSCDKQVMDRNYSIPTYSSDKLYHLITAIEKLMNRYEDVEKQLATKCSVNEAAKLEQRINELEQKLLKYDNEVAPKITELEDQIKVNVQSNTVEKENAISDEDLIKFVVQEEMNRKSVEERDHENRKRNVVMYRVPERKIDNVSERKSNDTEFVKDFLDGMFNMKMEDSDFEKMYRLGRWEEGKVRPLLVTFRKYEDKEYIMANLSNLKKPLDKFKGVSIAHDLHPKEREENKRMVEEAKREYEVNNGESAENYRFLVVGRGQRKKVITIKRKSSPA